MGRRSSSATGVLHPCPSQKCFRIAYVVVAFFFSVHADPRRIRWAQVQHKMYFMAAVAPDKASESYLRTLKISQVQTAFYAFFRQTNSSRLEGGCSGSGQRNLSGMSLQHVGVLLQFIRVLRKMNSCLPRPKKEGILAFLQEQYKANGEPARNRHVLELVRDMEIELSRSIRFEVKEIGGKQYLTEGNTSRWLPEKPPGKWLAEILHDKSSGVPFVKHSNGEVAPCISFFQNGEDYQSRPRSLAETLSNPDLVSSSSTGPPPPVPSPYVQPLQRQLLPGMEVPGWMGMFIRSLVVTQVARDA